MEVQLTSAQHDKLSKLAASQSRAEEALVQEAVDRRLSDDDWFSQEVDKGLTAADNGEFVEHSDVLRRIQDS